MKTADYQSWRFWAEDKETDESWQSRLGLF